MIGRGLPLWRRVVVLAVIGAAGGTILDELHVQNGVAAYHDVPLVPGLHVACWVPAQFAVAGNVIGLAHPALDRLLGRTSPPLSTGKVAAGIAAFCGVWFLSGWLARAGWSSGPITLATVVAVLGLWAWLDRTAHGLGCSLLTAAAGVTVEWLITLTGRYAYVTTDFMSVPAWLATLYVAGTVAMGNLGRYLAGDGGAPDDL
jgi:hypothetical protein